METPDLENRLRYLLQQHFQFTDFRHGQLDILRSVLQGRDALAVMPTGGGKSLCYQVPALASTGIIIVVSPLISLMKDQVESLRKRGIPCGCLHTGQSLEEKRAVFAELKSKERFLLYLSPERIQKPGFASWIQRQRVLLFAIDEAHCVSQWGPEFREDYHRLGLLRELRPEIPILALTATATPPVLRDITQQLQLKTPDRHIYGFYRSNLYCQVEACETEWHKRQFLHQALQQFTEGRVLIYCGTRKQCESIADELSVSHASIDFYHAGLNSERRHQIQSEFQAGHTRILIATNAFGMGIDRPDVRLVIHYQIPANIESYYQEMGRAGRDGKDATCALLYSKRDKSLHTYFITQSEANSRHIKQRWRALETIIQFAEGAECRHGGILTYFRDSQRISSCNHCDVCVPSSSRRIRFAISNSQLEKVPEKRKKSISSISEPLEGEIQERYQTLRKWRKDFAAAKDIPAFLVFSNKTLYELAMQNPASLSELESIYGLGPHKVEAFGSELLAELEKFR